MALPFRDLRVRKHAEYGLVYAASRKHRSATFSFFYRQRFDPESGPARFGITVPRAIGPAVARNRIKRRVRAAARARLFLLPPAIDVVLHPRPEVGVMPFGKLDQELETVFTTVARRVAAGADNTPLPRAERPVKTKKKAKPAIGSARL